MAEEPAIKNDETTVLNAMDNPFFTARLADEFLREMKEEVIKLMHRDKRRLDVKTMQACFLVFRRRHQQEFIKMLK